MNRRGTILPVLVLSIVALLTFASRGEACLANRWAKVSCCEEPVSDDGH
jgi:hypothetical protein